MTDEDDDSSDRAKDPFEQFESEVADREGDPFENLSGEGTPDSDDTGDGKSTPARDSADPGGAGGGPESNQSRDGATGEAQNGSRRETLSEGSADWVDEFGVDDEFSGQSDAVSTGEGSESEGDVAASEEHSELSERSMDVGRRDDGLTDPLGDVGDREGDPFEEGNSLFEERDTEGIDPDSVWQELASADSSTATGEEFERTFADVSKHSYCEQCEHFSSPPEIACTHEGTDIVEFLDMETVRVVDCPIVAERRELERDE